jgi:hypothetical protein
MQETARRTPQHLHYAQQHIRREASPVKQGERLPLVGQDCRGSRHLYGGAKPVDGLALCQHCVSEHHAPTPSWAQPKEGVMDVSEDLQVGSEPPLTPAPVPICHKCQTHNTPEQVKCLRFGAHLLPGRGFLEGVGHLARATPPAVGLVARVRFMARQTDVLECCASPPVSFPGGPGHPGVWRACGCWAAADRTLDSRSIRRKRPEAIPLARHRGGQSPRRHRARRAAPVGGRGSQDAAQRWAGSFLWRGGVLSQ